MDPDYTQMMDQLRSGELSQIEITPETFNAFRAAWTNYPARKEIVGTAGRLGAITYHYRPIQDD
ncbi:hypothetical protein [Lacticaseibacillus jixiensis]|uniref:hypothetical protein n=1 Tax=Lacticaseibacillus jixiensis TaxID=3231926 RepID=UPI0036F21340